MSFFSNSGGEDNITLFGGMEYLQNVPIKVAMRMETSSASLVTKLCLVFLIFIKSFMFMQYLGVILASTLKRFSGLLKRCLNNFSFQGTALIFLQTCYIVPIILCNKKLDFILAFWPGKVITKANIIFSLVIKSADNLLIFFNFRFAVHKVLK